MSGAEKGKARKELEILRIELGLRPSAPSSFPNVSPPDNATPIILNVDGQEIAVWVPAAAKHAYRQKFNELARREKRRAADAGNAATTSQLVGGGIGGALATGGLIALATASAPLSIAAEIATGAGAIIACVGFVAGHWMNKKKFAHEEKMDEYSQLAEEMK